MVWLWGAGQIDLISTLKNRFLNDPNHGLDSYLSRRIRHHSMMGYPRGVLEEHKLITTKSHITGKYTENIYWKDKITDCTPTEWGYVAKLFQQFSQDIDSILLALKTEIFHIQTPEHPKGIFELNIPPAAIHIARSAIQMDLTLDGFCQVCFAVFWAALDESLSNAKKVLLVDTNNGMQTAFHKLKVGLKKTLSETTRYPELNYALAQANEESRKEFIKISEWFSRSEQVHQSKTHSFDRVLDIAIQSALSSQRPFNPRIVRHIDTDLEFVSNAVLVVISEILLTVIGNVRQHCHCHVSPTIEISLRCKSDEEILRLRVESSIGPDAISTAAINKVESIRKEIIDGSYISKIRSEGNSGLKKIASTAYQSSKGRIDFGFINIDKFFIEVDLSFIHNQEMAA